MAHVAQTGVMYVIAPKRVRMKLLLIEPGALWLTADVSAGLGYGLEQLEVVFVRYRLVQRIDRSNRWMYSNWRRTKKSIPAIQKPPVADVFYQAGIGVLEMAVGHQVDCVLVVRVMFMRPDVIILMKLAGLQVAILFQESPYVRDKEIAVVMMVAGFWESERTGCGCLPARSAPRAGYVSHGWHLDCAPAGATGGRRRLLAA